MAKFVLYPNKPSEQISYDLMTSMGANTDDGNYTFDSSCGFQIGSRVIEKIYVHGNCYFILRDSAGNNIVTFQPATTDGRILDFYIQEIVDKKYCVYTWKGRSRYSGADDLTYQVKVFENGVIEFLCLSTYSSTTSYILIGETNQKLTFTYTTGKSYVFTPSEDNGTTYSMTEGSYDVQDKFMLVEDDGVLKTYSYETNQYTKVGDLPYTSEMFMKYGFGFFPSTREGLVNPEPKVHIYTEGEKALKLSNEYLEKRWYKIQLKSPYNVELSKINNIAPSFDTDELSDVRCVLNKNGLGWFSFIDNAWVEVNIESQDEITEKGMTKEQLSQLNSENLSEFNSFKFAIFVKKTSDKSVVKLNNIDFVFVNPITETVEGN